MKDYKALSQRFAFLVSVALLMYSSQAVLNSEASLAHVYTALYIVLVAARVVQYSKQKDALFCIDMCYFVNAGVVLYIYALPHTPELFLTLFGIANGPVLAAVVPFQNK